MTTSPARPTPPAAPAAPLVAVACPACFGALSVGTDLAGLPADCPLCGSGFRVPPLALPPTPRPAQSPDRALADSAPEPRRAPGHGPSARSLPTPAHQEPADAPLSGTMLDAVTSGPEPQADAGLTFREPVLTVGSGDNAIVLRRLSPEERAARRTRRNLVMLVGGISILLTIVLLLGRKR